MCKEESQFHLYIHTHIYNRVHTQTHIFFSKTAEEYLLAFLHLKQNKKNTQGDRLLKANASIWKPNMFSPILFLFRAKDSASHPVRKKVASTPDFTLEKLTGWGDPMRTTGILRVSKRTVANSEEAPWNGKRYCLEQYNFLFKILNTFCYSVCVTFLKIPFLFRWSFND